MIDKKTINAEVDLINNAFKNNNLSCNIYFEYYDGVNTVDGFRYAESTADIDTMDSMVERFIKTFKEPKVNDSELAKFDILKKNKDFFYYADSDQFINAKKVIDKLNDIDFLPEEDLKVIKNLKVVKGIIVKLVINSDNPDTFYLFINVDKFNAFKKKKMSSGFMGNLNSDGITRITDNKMIFGVKDKIGFYYHKDHFVINSHVDFERMLFLIDEYKKRAKVVAQGLNEFKEVLVDVNKLENDLTGLGSTALVRMLVNLSLKDLNEKFNDKNKKSSIKKLKEITQFKDFKNEFEGIGQLIDEEKCQITYTNKEKFKFIALLSDKPSQTLFLGKKFID
ncbi:hypothetical protein [Latilactobacillus sakei]|uniref:hypothetical protein n=1 Tax=Latilactobacillus sakei TaxID=1599 RepID=UPI0034A42C41